MFGPQAPIHAKPVDQVRFQKYLRLKLYKIWQPIKADNMCRNYDRCHQCVKLDYGENCDKHKGYKFEARQDSVTGTKAKVLFWGQI